LDLALETPAGHVYISMHMVYDKPENVNMLTPAIQELCQRDGKITSSALADALGISRQAAHRQLAAAVSRGDLRAIGHGRGSYYQAVVPTFRFELGGAQEDDLLQKVEQRLNAQLDSLGLRLREIFNYVFTEMVNNAIDHSRGTAVAIQVECEARGFRLIIEDDGIGAFASIRRATGLKDFVEAAAELTKGKVTSAPEQHTGEGLFFTSRVADRFSLQCNGLEFVSDNLVDDVAIRECEFTTGTRVEFGVDDPPRTTIQAVFEAHQEGFEFAKTRTIVRLFGLGRDFVSRSEARRLLNGLEAFREVVVDFRDVPGVGQGFADEVFRVWANRHPEVLLVPVNMVEPVRFFVERAEHQRQTKS
jgi:anti-sigma regulatory factor (Ser/Thr protein kinase)